MLVLSRKPRQKILIGDTVVVTVTRIGRRAVSIGIDAPEDVRIQRENRDSDAAAIESDWVAVGKDMSGAIQQFRHNFERNENEERRKGIAETEPVAG